MIASKSDGNNLPLPGVVCQDKNRAVAEFANTADVLRQELWRSVKQVGCGYGYCGSSGRATASDAVVWQPRNVSAAEIGYFM